MHRPLRHVLDNAGFNAVYFRARLMAAHLHARAVPKNLPALELDQRAIVRAYAEEMMKADTTPVEIVPDQAAINLENGVVHAAPDGTPLN